ncbi:glutamine amidotransferase [Pseudaminobacter sp. 19-2017]|uniref:Glutamine amidotransferase n=1 Tax=Pseudaminobacter soli (ex Zhang et al. 2022) TaxID=2831468 RepID=A0A942E021_9HYPH|nr:glutamine amidotransferase [Pseudaminobacter soli]MBS3648325.1 glutamine amidotransferase [Pseudaminobacter soli]
MDKKSRRVVLVRHGDDPPDDRVHSFLVSSGFEPVIRKPFAGDLLGEPDESLAGTVVYGGKYNVFDIDLHPFLLEEYRWIEACLKADVPLLGICQGAQQIAYHLGAKVGPGPGTPHEFGYYTIYPDERATDFLLSPLVVTQSHFHMFGIPEGAQRLASSDLFPNQAFRYGEKVYGLQFHAEVTIEGFRRWQSASSGYYGKPGAQSREEQDRLMIVHDATQAEWFYAFLAKLFGKDGGRL